MVAYFQGVSVEYVVDCSRKSCNAVLDLLHCSITLFRTTTMSHPFPTMQIPRPTSPDFSIISPPSPTLSQLHLPQCNTPTPSWFPSRKQLAGISALHGKPIRSILPRLWDALSSPVRRRTRFGFDYVYPDFDYADLLPLDGEEGELIDDEACFIDVRAVTGIGTSSQSHLRCVS
jgi:hypothetical protein